MLNISGINNGVVLDHIQAGKSMDIYHYLNLQELDCQVAIIKNAKSSKMGRKDIIKIEGSLDLLDLDALGYIDHKITVNIIKDGVISEKKILRLPKRITNVIHCKNPRCITSIEQELPHVFDLTDEEIKYIAVSTVRQSIANCTSLIRKAKIIELRAKVMLF